MISNLLIELFRINLALAAAIVLVLAVRLPVRRLFGPGLAYTLWIVPVLAALAVLIPAARAPAPIARPVAQVAQVATALPVDGALAVLRAVPVAPPQRDTGRLIFALWLAGGALSLGLVAGRQWRFLHLAARGEAGPAVSGFFVPRIVVPRGFETRFTPTEQPLILAHEQVHLERHDARINTLVALAGCAFWFNPMVHLAAFCQRLDQELACDAAVIARQPRARRLYAEALLRTQMAGSPPPFGCAWPARSRHPLEARVAMLAQSGPGRRRALAGAGLTAVLAFGGAYAAWASQPLRPPLPSLPRLAPSQARAVVVAVPPASPRPPADPAARAAEDARIVDEAGQAYAAGGAAALAVHIPALKRVLAHAPRAYPSLEVGPAGALVRGDPADFPARSMQVSLQAAAHDGGTLPISLAPNTYPAAGLLIATHASAIGRPAAALSALDRSLSMQPDNARLAAARGEVLAGQNRWSDALAAFDAGMSGGYRNNADEARLLRDKAQALTELGRFDEARAAYDQAFKRQPADPALLDQVAELGRRQNQQR